MNNNTAAKILTGILFALASSGAMAQSALQQLGEQTGADVAPLSQQMKDARAEQARGPVGVPLHSKDIFAGCSSYEAKPFLPWTPKQAALIVQTCLNNAYPADGRYTVTAAAARFGVRTCAQGQAATCHSIAEVIGIKITVDGKILTGDGVLGGLNFSIEKRGGKLLGFDAIVDDQAQILH
jgi:hypothetical protein